MHLSAAIIASLVVLGVAILLIVPINRLAQRIFPTKQGASREDRFIYGVIVNIIWVVIVVVVVQTS